MRGIHCNLLYVHYRLIFVSFHKFQRVLHYCVMLVEMIIAFACITKVLWVLALTELYCSASNLFSLMLAYTLVLQSLHYEMVGMAPTW